MHQELEVPVRIEAGTPAESFEHVAHNAVHAVFGQVDGCFLFAETGIIFDGEALQPAEI